MFGMLKHIDRILRGEATRVELLRTGNVPIPAGTIAIAVIVMGMIYGFFMGWYALINRENPVYMQMVATTVKVPALFILTLLVTFPSLYVFNALVGSRLSFSSVFKLLIAAMAVSMAVLASFGTITAFFSVTTESYPFMVLLNVVLFSVAGILGTGFLLRTLHRLSVANQVDATPVRQTWPPAVPEAEIIADEDTDDQPAAERLPELPAQASTQQDEPLGALDPLKGYDLGPQVQFVFTCWVLIFGVVGGQMSWVLRPFIGNPELPFTWFRPRYSNFFEAVFKAFTTLLGVES